MGTMVCANPAGRPTAAETKETEVEVSEAIRTRRSTREFTSQAVPREVVTEILDEARWAPSWANAQGWDVFAITGQRLGAYAAMMATKMEAGAEPDTDVRFPQRGEWPDYIQERMTYRRPSPGAPAAPPARPGLARLYGAPWMLLFAVDERLATEYACFDSGLLVQSVCLAAHSRGLGTCIMAMAVRHAQALHELVPEAAGRRFVIAVALGHPDPDSPLNGVERERAPLADIVMFLD
jgi:nitroreductase